MLSIHIPTQTTIIDNKIKEYVANHYLDGERLTDLEKDILNYVERHLVDDEVTVYTHKDYDTSFIIDLIRQFKPKLKVSYNGEPAVPIENDDFDKTPYKHRGLFIAVNVRGLYIAPLKTGRSSLRSTLTTDNNGRMTDWLTSTDYGLDW